MSEDFCPDCPRRKKAHPGPVGAVLPSGPLDAPILIVGVAHGAAETALLRSHGAPLGLFAENCRRITTTKCAPAGGKKGKTLTADQLAACRGYFEEQLRLFKGKVILCLGPDAFESVTGLIGWERLQNKHAVKGVVYQDGSHGKAKPVGIEQWRGYCVRPSTCPTARRTVLVKDYEDRYQVGGLCPVCKGRDEILSAAECDYCNSTGRRKKGDPKLVERAVQVPRVLPPNVEWIIGTYHTSYIMATGMKVLPAFVNDIDRALRAWRGKLELVKVEYEERLP